MFPTMFCSSVFLNLYGINPAERNNNSNKRKGKGKKMKNEKEKKKNEI